MQCLPKMNGLLVAPSKSITRPNGYNATGTGTSAIFRIYRNEELEYQK